MSKRISGGRLPGGQKMTKSDAVYIRAWRKLYRPLEKITGWAASAFDPGVVYHSQDGHGTCLLPVALLLKINKVIADRDRKRKVIKKALKLFTYDGIGRGTGVIDACKLYCLLAEAMEEKGNDGAKKAKSAG